MATPALEIFIDVDRQESVFSKADPTPVKLATWTQADSIPLRIFPIQRISQVQQPIFRDVQVSGYSMRLYLTALNGADPIKASMSDSDFTANTGPITAENNAENFFSGVLDLNTSELDDHVEGNTLVTDLYLQLQISEGAAWRTIYQQFQHVRESGVAPAGAENVPSPVTQYYSRAQSENSFVQWGNNGAGRTFTLVSPDGTRSVELGCDDNGVFFANPL